MAMTRQKYKNDCIILNTLDELVPKDHLVRKLDNCIDFTFIEDLVEDLYSIFGRPSVPPVVLFKMIFINIIFGINSMRKTCEECKVNIAYRWFLGLSIYDEIPNYSTWSQNYIRRYKNSDVFDKIFERILEQAIEYGYVDTETVFGDCKEQHCLRYTRVRGLEKNKNNATMIFACHDLKKMAIWRWKTHPNINENNSIFENI